MEAESIKGTWRMVSRKRIVLINACDANEGKNWHDNESLKMLFKRKYDLKIISSKKLKIDRMKFTRKEEDFK